MVIHARTELSKTNYRVFQSEGREGRSFGEKFGNAISDIFRQGYDSVIAVGNDCPSLNKQLIERAALVLNTGRSVIGKTKDGGIYLLGIHKTSFDLSAFTELAWQTPKNAHSVYTYLAQRKVSVYHLPTSVDIDNPQDLISAQNEKLLSKQLLNILFGESRIIATCIPLENSHFYISPKKSRAPPVLQDFTY